jgi:hypothetical protein
MMIAHQAREISIIANSPIKILAIPVGFAYVNLTSPWIPPFYKGHMAPVRTCIKYGHISIVGSISARSID